MGTHGRRLLILGLVFVLMVGLSAVRESVPPRIWEDGEYEWRDSGTEWAIGIMLGEDPFRWRVPPAEVLTNPVLTARDVTDLAARFVADPFMIKVDDMWYMFMEVLDAERHQGVIAYAISADGFSWDYQHVVIDEEFHLSYPFIFQHDSDFYMVLESWQDDSIRLYKADSFPDGWSFQRRIMRGVHVDNTIVSHDSRWYMFVGARHTFDRLTLYHSEQMEDGWSPHAMSPILEGNPHHSRPGGRVIPWDGGLIRYAQDCFPRYGHAVNAFFIEELTPETYVEVAWDENPILYAGMEEWNSVGMHHIDPHELEDGDWIALVDGIDYVQPDHRIRVAFDDDSKLLGYNIRPLQPQAGRPVMISFYWKGLPEIKEDHPYSVFVHFVNMDGKIEFQADYNFINNVEKYDAIFEVPATAAGEYEIWTGVYNRLTGERLRFSTRERQRYRRRASVKIPFNLRIEGSSRE